MVSTSEQEVVFEQLDSLTAEIREAARHLSAHEARYLVDTYYQMQEDRKRSNNQERSLTEAGEPSVLMSWMAQNHTKTEGNIKRLLQAYAEGSPVGSWSMSQLGIGPVIAAGLLAHIDISKAPTVGHIWRFAGLDPTVTWGKGEKRPWNARLKVLCWKIGDSFVKVSGRENAYYGKVYRARKALEVERNDAGKFADLAAATLAAKKMGDNVTRKAYEAGKLPDGRLDLRARRYAVKLFLSHWHHVAYEVANGAPPPLPYIFTDQAKAMGLGDHVHYEAPPNWPMA